MMENKKNKILSEELSWRSSGYIRSNKQLYSYNHHKKLPGIERKIKKSYGVIIVRVNDITKKLEAVLVKGKYTYSFGEFIKKEITIPIQVNGTKQNSLILFTADFIDWNVSLK